MTEIPKFAAVANDVRVTSNGRLQERQDCYRDIGAITIRYSTAELAEDFAKATIPHAAINTIPQVRDLEALRGNLTTTRTPDGKLIHMQPMAIDVDNAVTDLPFAPKYGQHTRSVLAEAGYTTEELTGLATTGIIADPTAVSV